MGKYTLTIQEILSNNVNIFDFDYSFYNESYKKGFEQKGIRPVIVISNDVFNKHSNMIVVLPITSNVKEFPTHYILEDTKKVHGSVLCEHIRSIDYEIRNLKFVEKLSENDFISIITLLNACIEE